MCTRTPITRLYGSALMWGGGRGHLQAPASGWQAGDVQSLATEGGDTPRPSSRTQSLASRSRLRSRTQFPASRSAWLLRDPAPSPSPCGQELRSVEVRDVSAGGGGTRCLHDHGTETGHRNKLVAELGTRPCLLAARGCRNHRSLKPLSQHMV